MNSAEHAFNLQREVERAGCLIAHSERSAQTRGGNMKSGTVEGHEPLRTPNSWGPSSERLTREHPGEEREMGNFIRTIS